jgi:hypothetical protein
MGSRTVAGAALLALLGGAGAGAPTEHMKIFANLPGEVLIDNPRVRVERLVLAPGAATGAALGGADALLVFVRGGVLRSPASGRATLWRAGRVLWRGAQDPAEAGGVNAGREAIEIVAVVPKAAPAAGGRPGQIQLDYPNIPGEDLFENERLAVQRFVVAPGQWEGVHGHRPDTLYIHIKGGQWAARSRTEAEHLYPEPSPDGEVGWMDPIDPAVGHESGNAGSEPIDLIWVSLK